MLLFFQGRQGVPGLKGHIGPSGHPGPGVEQKYFICIFNMYVMT